MFQLEHEWLKELEGVVSKTTTAKKEVNRWVWKGENSEPCSVSGSIANEPEPLFLCLVYVRIVITNLRVCH